MILVVAALMVGAALVWLGRRSGRGRRPGRSMTLFSGLTLLGAVATAAHGDLLVAAILASIAAGPWVQARLTGPPPDPALDEMSEAQARGLLGVGADAGRAEIQAAYLRLIRTVHPDRGGTAGLAAQLNAARERLLRR